MAFTPQPDFTIHTLTNGAQVVFHYDSEGYALRLLHRHSANDAWSALNKFDVSNPSQTGEHYIGTRGGVVTYLAAIVATCNTRIRELHPQLFTAPEAVMPDWLKGEHPATVQLLQRVLGIKLVNNQLVL